MFESKSWSLIAVFAALTVVCDALVTTGFSAGVWFGWSFLISPLAGIVLGPYRGFISTLIGVMTGHLLIPRGAYEFIFTLGAPVCSMMAGFMFGGKWRRVLIYYTGLLAIYFLTPISRQLPLWGMWDCYVAYGLLITVGIISTIKGSKVTSRIPPLAVSAFLGLEADVLLRIFILVPMQAYRLFYGLTPEALAAIWAAPAPVLTPFKVLLSTFLSTLMGPQILDFLKKYET
ncbi:MAG: hypothetical protein ACOC6G_03135 [Thermoproteota archaeon]